MMSCCIILPLDLAQWKLRRPSLTLALVHARGKLQGIYVSSNGCANHDRFGFAKFFEVHDSEMCIRGFHALGYEVGFARVGGVIYILLVPRLTRLNRNPSILDSRLKATKALPTCTFPICPRLLQKWYVSSELRQYIVRLTMMRLRNLEPSSSDTPSFQARSSGTVWATVAVLDLLGMITMSMQLASSLFVNDAVQI